MSAPLTRANLENFEKYIESRQDNSKNISSTDLDLFHDKILQQSDLDSVTYSEPSERGKGKQVGFEAGELDFDKDVFQITQNINPLQNTQMPTKTPDFPLAARHDPFQIVVIRDSNDLARITKEFIHLQNRIEGTKESIKRLKEEATMLSNALETYMNSIDLEELTDPDTNSSIRLKSTKKQVAAGEGVYRKIMKEVGIEAIVIDNFFVRFKKYKEEHAGQQTKLEVKTEFISQIQEEKKMISNEKKRLAKEMDAVNPKRTRQI